MKPIFKRDRAAAIVLHKDRLLSVRRLLHGQEYYALPGGGIDKGETPEQAAVRETQEETSVKVKPLRLLYKHTYSKYGTHYYFLCQYISGRPALGDSDEAKWHKLGHNEYHPQWLAINELGQIELRPSDVREWLINDLKKGFKDKLQTADLAVHGDWQRY